jgi:Domain of unknown function (DUF4440)
MLLNLPRGSDDAVMHPIQSVAAVALLAVPPAACVSLRPTEPVQDFERARFAAMTRQDLTGLERMLAPDLIYCHSNGTCETKEQALATLAGGHLRYKAIRIERIQARAVGDAEITHGTISIDIEENAQPLTLHLVYTAVYVARGGHWQLTAWQSTRIQ